MKILLLLGKNEEYLNYKVFQTDEELDEFLKDLTPLMLTNISSDLPLRKRLNLLPKNKKGEVDYFLYAGAVQGFEIIDLNSTKDEEDEHG